MSDEYIHRDDVEKVVENLIADHFKKKQSGLYYRGANAMRCDIMKKIIDETEELQNQHDDGSDKFERERGVFQIIIDAVIEIIKVQPLPTAPQDKKEV